MNDASMSRDLDGIHNFRPLGPYPLTGERRIRPGMVYRSGALDRMTDADRTWLTEVARISTILDLRHPDEIDPLTDRHALSDRVLPLSIFPLDTRQEDLIAELNGLYGTGPSPERYLHYLDAGGPKFAQAFRLLADERSYPILVHCVAGKDRTGVLVGLLMELLGANDADIASEYGLSDASIDRLIAYIESTGRKMEGTAEEIRARLATPPERMAGFTRLVRERYGGAAGFLSAQGMTSSDLDSIRQLMTVPA